VQYLNQNIQRNARKISKKVQEKPKEKFRYPFSLTEKSYTINPKTSTSTSPKGSNSTHSVLPKSTQNKTQNHDTHMVSLLKIFPKQTKKNGNQSPTYRKMNCSLFGCRENARKRRPLALPASGRDPPASGAVVHPQRWLAHLASISGSLQLSLQLSRPPSPISLSRSLSGKKEKSEKKDARGEH